jgi:Kef-type K+ transport system membrane component KefB
MSYILGGLGARVDLLQQNFTLSMVGAATGVCFPIGLSYPLLYLGFGYGWFRLSLILFKLTWSRRGGDLHHRCGSVCYLIG